MNEQEMKLTKVYEEFSQVEKNEVRIGVQAFKGGDTYDPTLICIMRGQYTDGWEYERKWLIVERCSNAKLARMAIRMFDDEVALMESLTKNYPVESV